MKKDDQNLIRLDPHASRPPLPRMGAGLVILIWGAIRAFQAASDMDSVNMLISCGIIVVGGALLGPVLAQFISAPAGRIFYPGDRLSRPQPAYSIPLSKRKFGKYEEAIAALRAIVEEFPDELDAWTEMLDIVITDLKDPIRARLIYLEGRATLSKTDDQETLGRTYRAQTERLERRQQVEAQDKQLCLDFPQDVMSEEGEARLERHWLDIPKETKSAEGGAQLEQSCPDVLQDAVSKKDAP